MPSKECKPPILFIPITCVCFRTSWMVCLLFSCIHDLEKENLILIHQITKQFSSLLQSILTELRLIEGSRVLRLIFPCMFWLTFADAMMKYVQSQWFLKVFLIPCSDSLCWAMSVLKCRAIWNAQDQAHTKFFSALSCMFSRFSESFDDIMYWWDLTGRNILLKLLNYLPIVLHIVANPSILSSERLRDVGYDPVLKTKQDEMKV